MAQGHRTPHRIGQLRQESADCIIQTEPICRCKLKDCDCSEHLRCGSNAVLSADLSLGASILSCQSITASEYLAAVLRYKHRSGKQIGIRHCLEEFGENVQWLMYRRLVSTAN